MTQTAAQKLIYLSREGAIEEYNLSLATKRVLFESEYLRNNSKNLLQVCKRDSILILVFREPFLILYINISNPKTPITTTHDPLIQLKERI